MHVVQKALTVNLKLLFSDHIAMFYILYFKFKKYCFFTCAAVDLVFTKFQILSRTLIGNLYKPMKNLERYCPKYVYLRLHVKCLLVCSILTKLKWSTNLGKNSLCKLSSKPPYWVPNSSLRMVRCSYRRANITNLIVDFRSCFVKWSKI
jgi:hypothetical protein